MVPEPVSGTATRDADANGLWRVDGLPPAVGKVPSDTQVGRYVFDTGSAVLAHKSHGDDPCDQGFGEAFGEFEVCGLAKSTGVAYRYDGDQDPVYGVLPVLPAGINPTHPDITEWGVYSHHFTDDEGRSTCPGGTMYTIRTKPTKPTKPTCAAGGGGCTMDWSLACDPTITGGADGAIPCVKMDPVAQRGLNANTVHAWLPRSDGSFQLVDSGWGASTHEDNLSHDPFARAGGTDTSALFARTPVVLQLPTDTQQTGHICYDGVLREAERGRGASSDP
jgi:hypothetical protein